MRQTVGWPTCSVCGHRVNPRSERCDQPHPLCTVDGCQPFGHYAGMDLPDPLGGADDATIRALAAPPRAAGRTLYLLDIASYQAGINLAVCKAAGWSNVNIKTSQGTWYQHAAAVVYAKAAQALGMGISGFHWLDSTDTGANQARYCWQILRQMIDAVGHPIGLQKDNEDPARPATWAITRDFVNALSDLMGHLPFAYTGDWWATGGGRATWDVHSLTPWLMSAPNAGYPGTYPGDTSPQWWAGYWGYGDLAAMQYAVSPIDGAGGGQISKAAIRDPTVWAAITGGATDMADYGDLALVNGHAPNYPYGPDPATIDIEEVLRTGTRTGWSNTDGAGWWLPLTLNSLLASARSDEVRDTALAAALAGTRTAVDALAAVVAAGGGNVDAAAIVAAVHEAADRAAADATTLHTQLDAAAAREADLRARLVEALAAPAA